MPGLDQFGPFVICRTPDGQLDLLGRGAMGLTYRAWDTQLQREVALKLINPHYLDAPEVATRFQREARIAARLQHPNIAAVLHQGREGHAWFYVMELIEGENLHTYINRVGPLSPIHALQVTRQVLEALAAAARLQMIHRDLKPSNIMLTAYHEGDEPRAKVIDFGLAKLLGEEQDLVLTGAAFLGTPEFSSPEQCRQEKADARSDLYSLGITLWFLLTGGLPFTGSLLEVVRAQIECPPPLDRLEAPDELSAFLGRLLAKEARDRPENPLAAIRELNRTMETLTSEEENYHPLPQPASGIGRRRSPWSTARQRRKLRRILVQTALGFTALVSIIWAGTDPRWGQLFGMGQPDEEPNRPAATASPSPGPAPSSQQMAYQIPEDAHGDFTNSLGIEFRLLIELDIQVARTETSYAAFAEFATETGLPSTEWRRTSPAPGQPLVDVSPIEALAFCEWLTVREQSAGRLSPDKRYRLPTPEEWIALTGRGANGYPWGTDWPPPEGHDNFADLEALAEGLVEEAIPGYEDGYPALAPVTAFPRNAVGMHSIAGNVREWCRTGDQFVIKGAGWQTAEPESMQVSWQTIALGEDRAPDVGFRLVLGRAPLQLPLP